MAEIFDLNGLGEKIKEEFSKKEPGSAGAKIGEVLDLERMEEKMRAKNIVETVPVRPDAKPWLGLVDPGVIREALEKFCLRNIKPTGINIAQIAHGGEILEELVLYGQTESGGAERSSLAIRRAIAKRGD